MDFENACLYSIENSEEPDAGFLSRTSDIAASAGVSTFQEANSASGLLKSFVTGFVRPDKGLEAVGLLLESWWVKPSELGQRLDARYQKVYAESAVAESRPRFVFWLTLVVLGVATWTVIGSNNRPSFATNYDPIRSNADRQFDAEPSDSSTPVSHIDAIVLCPKCNARNRRRGLQNGQKIVCGRCKTELVST